MSTSHLSDFHAAVAARDAARHSLAACRARISDDAASLAAAIAAHREKAADAIGAGTKPPAAPTLSTDARALIDAEPVLAGRLADAEHAARIAATALRDQRIADALAHRLSSLAAAVARARADLATISECAGPGAVRRLAEQVGLGDPTRSWPAIHAAACSCPELAGTEPWPTLPSGDVGAGEIEHILAGAV